MARRLLAGIFRRFWRVAVAVAGGLLAGPALPRTSDWLAIFASVILIHWAIRGRGFWSGFRIGFPAGAAFYGSQSIWMTTYLGPVPWGALTVLEGFIFALGLGLAAGTWRLLSKHRLTFGNLYPAVVTLAVSGIWVAREYVSGHYPYGGYQWSRLGQAVANTQLAQIAYWGGISLVSWSVAVIAVGLLVWLSGKPWRRRTASRYWPVTLAALLPALTVISLASFTPLISSAGDGKTIRVVAVQGNANAGLFANPEPGSILNKHLSESLNFLAKNGANYDLMVWPENASDLNPLQDPLAEAQLRALVAKTGKPLLVGAITQRNGKMYNSGLLFRPDTARVDQYDKFRPVPFGEYVPDRPFFHSLAPTLVDLIYRDYTPGTRVGTFDVAGTKIGDLICFEIAIDDVTHQLVTDGATVLVSQANNSDFGHTDEAFQQEALVRLQAIAAGRSYVHASTVATTEIVNPQGRVMERTRAFTPQSAVANVPLSNQMTPAMRFYGWVDILSLLGAAVAVVALLWFWIAGLISAKSKARKLGSTEVN